MSAAPTTLLFIRHAETALAGTFCGSSDPPLNQAGEAQCISLGTALAAEPIAAVFASDLVRARQTAEVLAQPRGLIVQERPALREIAFGAWEGLRWAEIEVRDAAYAARWVAEFPALPAPEGESVAHLRARVLPEIASLREQAAVTAGALAIVTHAGVLRVLLEELGHFTPHHAWERTRTYTGILRCTQSSPTGALTIHPATNPQETYR